MSIVAEGTRVRFLNGPDVLHEGIVNGKPWAAFYDGAVHARIPVYCTTNGECIDVAGPNIVDVLDDDVAERIAEYGYSERV